jgi:DNA-binding LacI/PurR family transcriptional regulator
VLVDYGKSAGTGCSVVKTDDYAAASLALEYLWRHRHRRIAMISGTRDSQSSRDRIKSYRDFVEAKSLKLPGEYLQSGDYDWHSGYTSAVNLLNMKKLPTAIFAANDLMAIGAMKAISERGLHIPDDISVIGYDDIDMASLMTPALTTVKQPKYEMGQCSVNILIDLIENNKSKKDYEPSVQLIKTQIIERQSVGIPLSHAKEP